MSPEVVSILVGVLTILVGTTIVFGHRYSDKKDKFDEKSKLDELNEIRIEMRLDKTSLALEDVYHFLYEQLNIKKVVKKVWELFYETSSRRYINKLINELEQTFRESMNVQNVWDNLRCKYGQMGKVLYLLGAIEALAGYPLIALVAFNSFQSIEQFYLWGIGLFIVAIIFIGLIIYIQKKISYNLKIYNEIKKKYLEDGVRIEN